MTKYENAIVYKICCKDTSIIDIYIGSTCGFDYRKRNHKYNCNNENAKDYKIYLYEFIRQNGGWDNWDMIQIKKVECSSKRELELLERNEIENLKPSLNKNIPHRTKEEYREIFKNNNPTYYKDYYDKNKETRLEKKLCECGKYYSNQHYKRHIKSNYHLKNI